MIFSAEPRDADLFSQRTNKPQVMANAHFTPKKELCTCCGVRRTAETGKRTKSGRFICHGCKRK